MKKLLLVLVILVFTLTPAAGAQTYTFKVSPLQQELSSQPGGTVRTSISLQNITNKSATLQVSAVDFEQEDAGGNIKFIPDGNSEYGVAKWFADANVQRSLTIPANQTVTYEAVFRIPSGIQEKTYYGSVRFTDTSSLVALDSLLYITVGSPKTSLAISDIRFGESSQADERFGVFSTELTNSGKSLSHPALTLKITGSDGRNVAIISAKEESAVLPESIRTYTFAPDAQLPNEPLTITVTAVDEQGQTADKSIQLDRSEPISNAETKDSQLLQEKHAPWLAAFIVTGAILLAITVRHLYRHHKLVIKKASSA